MASSRPGWKTLSLLLTLYVVLYVVFVGEQWLQQSIQTERTYNRTFYTPALAEHAEQRAARWFTAAFVNTGVVQTSFEATVPTQADSLRSTGMEGFAGSLFGWWEGRLRAWWTVIYQSVVRFSTTLLWWPYALFLFVPWIIDGVVQRRIRKTSFAFSSPLNHLVSLYALHILAVGALVLFFLPLPLHPALWPVATLVAGLACAVALANFMKRA
jgi:hypothetical protein